MKKSLIVLFAAGVLCSCGRSVEDVPGIRSVSLTEPVLLESVHEIERPGIVREAHTVSLGFKAGGQIERIYVQEGDFVRKGELLAVLDDADYQLGVDALQIQYDQLKDEVGRTAELYEQKSVSANDYEKAVAGLKQLEIQLQVNKNNLEYTKLYAPADGYLQSVNFSPAEMVDAGTPVFTLLDVSHFEVVTDIPLSEFRLQDRFSGFYCKVPDLQEKIPMRLLSLTPRADGIQLYQLRLGFQDNPGKLLTAGMNVTIGISVKDKSFTPGFALPLRTVFLDGADNIPCVWVLEKDSTVSKRPVVLEGTDTEGRAVVTSGLAGDERIVLAGVNVLRDGDKVRPIEKVSKTNVGGLM